MKTCLRCACVFWVTWVLSLTVLNSETLPWAWHENEFRGTNGTIPPGWTHLTDPYESLSLHNDTLRFFRPGLAVSRGLRATSVVSVSEGEGSDPADWSDYKVIARLRGTDFTIAAEGLLQGVVARYADADHSGYTASIRAGHIDIFLNPGGNLETSQGTRIASAPLSATLQNDTWYWLFFEVSGSTLTARVFTDVRGSAGLELGRVSVNDGTYSVGNAGVRIGLTGTGDRSVSYDFFAVVPPAPHHPFLFAGTDEFAEMNLLATQRSDFATARSRLLNDADQCLAAIQSASFTLFSSSGPFPVDGYSYASLSGGLRDIGLAYALTGDAAYADALRDAMLAYARGHNPGWASSSLIGSGWLHPLAWAYDLSYSEFNAAERREIEGMLRTAVHELWNNARGGMNWQARINAAVGLTGLVIGDETIYRNAVFGEQSARQATASGIPPVLMGFVNHGFRDHIGYSLHGDGMWFEQSISYHYLAMHYLTLLAEAGTRRGQDLYAMEYRGRTLRDALNAILHHSYSGGIQPVFADADPEILIPNLASWFFAFGARRYGDPAFVWIWEDTPPRLSRDQRMPRLLALFAAHEAPSLEPGFRFRTGTQRFAPEGWNLFGSTLFGGVGMGVLRTPAAGEWNAETAFIYKPHGVLGNHQQADNLGIEISDGEHRWVPNTGKIGGYDSVLHQQFVIHTLSANTIVVDGISQNPQGTIDNLRHTRDSGGQVSRGELVSFAASRAFSFMHAKTSAVYDGVDLQRRILSAGDYVLDVSHARSDTERTYDWVSRFDAELEGGNGGLESRSTTLGNVSGYQHLSNIQAVFPGARQEDPDGWLYLQNPYDGISLYGNTLRVERPAGGAGLRASAVYVGQDLQEGDPATWTDYRVKTRLRGSHFTIASTAVLQGIIARYAGSGSQGYTASVRAGQVEIFRNPTGSLQTGQGSWLGGAPLSQALDNNTWYWLEFEVVGETLTAEVFLDDEGERGTRIGAVTVTDATHASGTAGVRVGLTGSDARSVSYDSISVTSADGDLLYEERFEGDRWIAEWGHGERRMRSTLLYSAGTALYLTEAPWRNDRRLPSPVVRRQGKEAEFVMLYSFFESENPSASLESVVGETAGAPVEGGGFRIERWDGEIAVADTVLFQDGIDEKWAEGIHYRGNAALVRARGGVRTDFLLVGGDLLAAEEVALRSLDGEIDMGWSRLTPGLAVFNRGLAGDTLGDVTVSVDGGAGFANGTVYELDGEGRVLGEVSVQHAGDDLVFAARVATNYAIHGSGAVPVHLPGMVREFKASEPLVEMLPESWQLYFFGEGGVDPYEDADGDGTSNWMEYLAGTDPTDSSSVFRVEILGSGDGLMLEFDTVAGRLYRIWGSADLATWEVIDTLSGDGSRRQFEVPGVLEVDSFFLRVEIALE